MLSDWARGVLFGALCLFFLAGISVWAIEEYGRFESECEMARSTHQNDGQNDQQGSGNLPSLRYPVPSGNGNTQSTGSENKYECLVAEYTGNLAVFTRWLVIVTGLLVIVTGGLVSFSRRQIADARAVQRAYVFVLAPKCDFGRWFESSRGRHQQKILFQFS
jgi:hypothetical protein